MTFVFTHYSFCNSFRHGLISVQCSSTVSVYLGYTLDRRMDDREEKLYWTVIIFAEAIKPEKGSNFKLKKSAIKIVALSSSLLYTGRGIRDKGHWTLDKGHLTLSTRH